MKIVDNILDLVGNTPIVKLNNLTEKDDANLYTKVEYFNPTRSIKARTALNMINQAEKDGLLNPDSLIVEATSGNTGIGLAMVAATKDYQAILIMPETVSKERINLMQAYGAKVLLTEAEKGMGGALAKAESILSKNPNSFMPNQFDNPANPAIHKKTTAQEIEQFFGKDLDVLVSTAGTGGTVSGIGERLRETNPKLKIYIVESENSPVISGGKSGQHNIPGTGPGFLPKNLNTAIYNRIYRIADQDALTTAKRLAKEEALLVGPSSGAAVHTALQVAKEEPAHKNILAIAPDTGERYFSTNLFQAD